MPSILLALACLLPLLAGCGRDAQETAPRPEPIRLLVAGQDTAGAVELRTVGGSEATRTICDGFDAVHAPAMHHDGERFCFLGRATAQASWRVYTAALDGSAPKAIDTPVDMDSAPAWLPDDRIVVSVPTMDASRALFVVEPTSQTAERITFSGTDARDPCVLRDGRILFAGMRTTPEGLRAPALYTVHPDGTGVLLFHGTTEGDAYAQPSQRHDGDVLFRVSRAGGDAWWLIDWRAPHETARAFRPPSDTLGFQRGSGFCLAAARPRPQGHMSMVDPLASNGSLLCVDARRGVEGPIASVRLFARVRQPDGGTYEWQALGRLPLEDDGSFFASVPADTPLRLDVLGADGALVRTSRTPFWVRPGETRGCTGCHEDPDTTPPNRQPLAAREAAVVPLRGAEGAR